MSIALRSKSSVSGFEHIIGVIIISMRLRSFLLLSPDIYSALITAVLALIFIDLLFILCIGIFLYLLNALGEYIL